MIQPLNPLPWHYSPFINNIESLYPVNDECVCQDLYDQDANYLLMTVNSFPKSIELLTACRNYMNFIPNKTEGIEHYTLLKEVDEFLKKIE